ncbi:HD domain-containing protein [Miniphocaeibacter halophilus]|uniref:HD domain-containing protein n=1 Tax=Miniphocaeibacter halophilus TaxID=2931922 RepID=UPI001FB38DF2|nr:HD domain-containing protein [Miniphocaeibacter halophilus]
MVREEEKTIEEFMLKFMDDSAHDIEHVYRVLNYSKIIASKYQNADKRIVIASALLHDIGRKVQFKNPEKCHAKEGGEIAYAFLKKIGWNERDCQHVKECIVSHRYRTKNKPVTIEAKIIFDADKLDVTGVIGIARTFLYQGYVNIPIYTVNENNMIHTGKKEDPSSFFREYNNKLKKVYNLFYTEEAREIAEINKKHSECFYNNLVEEITVARNMKFEGI